jgi:tocopherol cyclase
MNKYLEYFRHDLWRVMRPLAFHGAGKSGPFFEGWYFKLVSADGIHRLSVIPGVYLGKDHRDDHAFIQLIDGVSGHSDFYPFPFDHFSYEPGELDLRIGKNHFTQNLLSLDLDQPNMRLTGTVEFSGQYPWPVSVSSPGVMGWFAWVPGMECYHGVVSMDHTLTGSLRMNGKPLNFTEGRGYMEKDWGRAMPSAWIWMQTNHFDHPGVSLSFSVADIPWGSHRFTGFLGGLLIDGQLQRFATYTGAKISGLAVTDELVCFSVSDRKHRLDIRASRQEGGVLQAPTISQMDRRITESLSAQIMLTFSEKRNRRWIEKYSGTGDHAGLEVVGDLSILL